MASVKYTVNESDRGDVNGIIEISKTSEVSDDYPTPKQPKLAPGRFNGKSKYFKKWLEYFKKYYLHHVLCPALFAHRIELDMSVPYGEYQEALEVEQLYV